MSDLPNTTPEQQSQMDRADKIRNDIYGLLQFCLKRDMTQLRNQNMDEYKQVCMRTFTDIHQKYPSLFFMAVENPSSFDRRRFEELLSYKKKVEEEHETYEEVSKQLGERYYEEFVKNRIQRK
jgi:hypothetical protein